MSNTEKKIVLIIEDDEPVARVYGVKLSQDPNIETVIAGDGEEGLKKIISEKPQVVLLDLMLPKKDGFWVLGEVKKNKELGKIPILVLSNLGQETDKERAISLGAADYLIKADLSIKEVIEKVKSYLIKK